MGKLILALIVLAIVFYKIGERFWQVQGACLTISALCGLVALAALAISKDMS